MMAPDEFLFVDRRFSSNVVEPLGDCFAVRTEFAFSATGYVDVEAIPVDAVSRHVATGVVCSSVASD